jgi:hypothetical protein
MNSLKCTCCGSLNLVKTTEPWEDSSLITRNKISTYLCNDCGHYEFFSNNVVNKIKENCVMQEAQIKEEIEMIEKQLTSSLNITKDKQVELSKKLVILKEQLRRLRK